jgi:hypothetical protein
MISQGMVCGTGLSNQPQPGDPSNTSILTATSGFGGINVSWTFPEINPHAVAHTILYRSTSSNFATAIELIISSGNYYFDESTVENPPTYYYWIVIVSVNGTYGALIGPASATAKGMISAIMEGLTAQIDSGVLAQALRAKIEVIAKLDRLSALENSLINEISDRNFDANILAQAYNTLQANLDSATALLATEVVTRSTAASNLAQSVINESEARVAADTAEASLRVAGMAARSAEIAAEALTRADAILAEATARTSAITVEASARSTGDANLATQITTLSASQVAGDATLATAISTEASARASADTAEATARTTLAARVTTAEGTLATNTAAITTEAGARATAVSAEATARGTLATQMRGAYAGSDIASVTTGLLHSERVARSTADTAMATDITTLSTSLTTLNTTTAALVAAETTARTTAVLAEASARDTLSAQLRGTYTGNDVADVTTGLMFSERTARATEDAALSSRIDLISAASSGDFGDLIAAVETEQTARISGDSAVATSVGTLTTRLDNLKDGDGADTSKSLEATIADNKSSQVTGDSAIATTITALSTTVDTNLTSTNTLIADEATSRATAVSAEATTRESLATQMRGTYAGTDAALVTTGLVFSERESRITANTSLQTQLTALTATVTTGDTASAALVTAATTAQATTNTATASSISALTSTVADNDTSVKALIATEATTRATGDSSLSTQITTVSTQSTKTRTYRQTTAPTTGMLAGDLWFDTATGNKSYRYSGSAWVVTYDTRLATTAAAVITETSARTTADTALATSITGLTTTVTGNDTAVRALVTAEASTRATADTALTTALTTLSSTVSTNNTTNTSAVTAEASTRATADTTLSNSITALSSTVTGNDSSVRALVATESTTRATADTALSNSITALTSTVNANVGFDNAIAWTFDTSVEGWVPTNATISASNGSVVLTATATDPIVISPNFSISGATAPKIRARVKRLAGTGWDGRMFYKTATHGYVAGYNKSTPNSTVLNQWVVLEWDMAALTAGGTDWVNSTITGLRIDLGTVSGDSFEIDWLTIGRSEPRSYTALIVAEASTRATQDGLLATQITTAQAAQDTALATARTALETSITNTNTAITTLAGLVDTVQTAAGTNLASAKTVLETSITNTNDKVTAIGARYTAQVDVNGLVGGFGVYNNGTTVEAGFDVDTFWIGKTNANKRKPFIIDNDVVYIDSAAIIDASITNAHIANLSAAKLNVGTLSMDRLAAGSITADKITSNGLLIKDAAGNIILGAGNALNASYAAAGTLNSALTTSISNAALTATWNSVTGTGKPANNATVGATFGTNISGQMNSGTIWTYIANGAIQNALIGDAQINTLKVAGNSITVSGQCGGSGWTDFFLYAPEGGVINIVAYNSGRNDGQADNLVVHVNGQAVNNFRGTDVPGRDDNGSFYWAATSAATEINSVGVGPGNHQIAVYSSTYYRVLGLLTMR